MGAGDNRGASCACAGVDVLPVLVLPCMQMGALLAVQFSGACSMQVQAPMRACPCPCHLALQLRALPAKPSRRWPGCSSRLRRSSSNWRSPRRQQRNARQLSGRWRGGWKTPKHSCRYECWPVGGVSAWEPGVARGSQPHIWAVALGLADGQGRGYAAVAGMAVVVVVLPHDRTGIDRTGAAALAGRRC